MFEHLPAKQRAFLSAYAVLPSKTAAARASDVARESHYLWMREDEQYREAFAVAEAMGADAIEDSAVKWAQRGLLEPVLYKGEMVLVNMRDAEGNVVMDPATGEAQQVPLYRRKRSERLTLALLKRFKPEAYSDKHQHEHEVAPVAVTIKFVD